MPLPHLLLAVLLALAPATQLPSADEKEQRTPAQQKINSQLLYEIYRLRGEAAQKAVPPGPTGVKIDARGRALVAAAPSSRVSLCSSLKRSLLIQPFGSSSRRPSPQPESVFREVNMKTGRALAILLVLVLALYSPGPRLRAAAQPPADQPAADISP